MRVLLDECLPRRLKLEIRGHSVQTVPEAGWAGRSNGELLSLARYPHISVPSTAVLSQDTGRSPHGSRSYTEVVGTLPGERR